jgi:hypothetical protein
MEPPLCIVHQGKSTILIDDGALSIGEVEKGAVISVVSCRYGSFRDEQSVPRRRRWARFREVLIQQMSTSAVGRRRAWLARCTAALLFIGFLLGIAFL